MDDAVERYCAASEAGDIAGVMATLSPDVELVSPISGRMVFRGQDDVRFLLEQVHRTLRPLRWETPTGDGRLRLALGEGRVLGAVRLSDAMLFELDDTGRIRRVRPHLRPWLGLTAFAAVLGPRVARRPGVVARALR